MRNRISLWAAPLELMSRIANDLLEIGEIAHHKPEELFIARMFLKNLPILILDEATSALGTETEAAIQQSLEDCHRGGPRR